MFYSNSHFLQLPPDNNVLMLFLKKVNTKHTTDFIDSFAHKTSTCWKLFFDEECVYFGVRIVFVINNSKKAVVDTSQQQKNQLSSE